MLMAYLLSLRLPGAGLYTTGDLNAFVTVSAELKRCSQQFCARKWHLLADKRLASEMGRLCPRCVTQTV